MKLEKLSYFAVVLLATSLIKPVCVSGQDSGLNAGDVRYRDRDTVSLKVSFRQGKRQIDPGYMDNASNIASFTSSLQRYLDDYSIEVESVDIIGGASIEGSVELNEDLSNNRADRMVEILRRYASVPQYKVNVNSRGVNWEDVAEMVQNDRRVPYREKVLDIIRNVPESQRKASLQKLENSEPYMYMYDHIFPYVRTGKMTVIFRAVPKAPVVHEAVHDTVFVHQTDTIYHIHRDESTAARNINQNIMNVNPERYGRRGWREGPSTAAAARLARKDTLLMEPIIAFRSNLLLPAMNIGVEVPLGNRWSASADWYYPWVWRLPDHKNCFEFLGGTAEVRYWFGRRHSYGEDHTKYRLLGHSIGLLAGAGYYDFQENWAGFQGEYGAVGVDYQYAMPLGRKARTHLEFNIAVGYIGARNIPYDVFSEGGILLHRDGLINYFSWIGPIRGGVSLVVPIFRKNRPDSKQMPVEQTPLPVPEIPDINETRYE